MKKVINHICLTIIFINIFYIPQLRAQKTEEVTEKSEKQAVKNLDTDKWIAWDKFLHFTASAGITGLSYHFYHCQFNNPEKNSIYFSTSIAGSAGIGKEFYDLKIRRTGWSWKDITADAAGIIAGYLVFIKLKK